VTALIARNHPHEDVSMNLGLPHCGLYQGKADGGPLYAGKQVAGAGWWRRLGPEGVNRSIICHGA
jgi:hypothetical protein